MPAKMAGGFSAFAKRVKPAVRGFLDWSALLKDGQLPASHGLPA
jgi:hypothetical protein